MIAVRTDEVGVLRTVVDRVESMGLYVARRAALDPTVGRWQFNVIAPNGWKVDLMVREDRPFPSRESLTANAVVMDEIKLQTKREAVNPALRGLGLGSGGDAVEAGHVAVLVDTSSRVEFLRDTGSPGGVEVLLVPRAGQLFHHHRVSVGDPTVASDRLSVTEPPRFDRPCEGRIASLLVTALPSNRRSDLVPKRGGWLTGSPADTQPRWCHFVSSR